MVVSKVLAAVVGAEVIAPTSSGSEKKQYEM